MWMMRWPLSEPAKEDMPSVAHATAAAPRRQRRSRQFLRHERLTVALLLAERDHHTAPRGQKQARCLGEPRGPQERVQQRTVEQLADVVPMVQILDVPVPQMEDQRRSRMRRSRMVLLEPQTAEQLVEVPTVVSFSSLQQTAEQSTDIPVPRTRGDRAHGPDSGHSCSTDGGPASFAHASISHGALGAADGGAVGGGADCRVFFLSAAVSTDIPVPRTRGLILGCQPHPQSRVMRRFKGFSHFSPSSKKCAVRREVECEGARALELMDAGGFLGRGGGEARGKTPGDATTS